MSFLLGLHSTGKQLSLGSITGPEKQLHTALHSLIHQPRSVLTPSDSRCGSRSGTRHPEWRLEAIKPMTTQSGLTQLWSVPWVPPKHHTP